MSAVAATQKNDRPDVSRFAAIAVQLALVLLVMFLYEIERPRGMERIIPLIFVGFVIHAWLPLRFRMPFFLAVSVASVVLILGLVNSAWLFAIGLAMIGVCHLPISLIARVAILVATGVVLAAMQVGRIRTGWAPAVLPILGAMFMFRLAVYLYDIRNEKEHVPISARLAYFFMLPNACFPLYPVVDYRAFLRSHYKGDALDTYQTGVKWMLRGVTHLLFYRLIYQTFTDTPADVEGLGDVVVYMLSTYLLYLRISGLFHLIVGILCLFGFSLPETHHLYYLASSFNDFWRRINIYWKDFMMKLFYYPTLMRARKLGPTMGMVIATIVVFFGTWILHAYQWFWLRGTFPITAVDSVFWGLLGVLVVINSIYQAKFPKKGTLGKPKWSTKKAAIHSLKVVAMFSFMTALWALWSGSSLKEWWSLIQVASTGSAAEFGLFAAVVAVLVVLGIGIQYVQHTGWSLWAKGPKGVDTRPWFLRPSATTMVGCFALIALGLPEVDELLPSRAGGLLISMKSERLNKRDEQLLERGYYEGLLAGGKWGSKVWEARLQRPPADWIAFGESDAVMDVGGITRYELKPSHTSTHARVTIITNEWGMRDKPYTKEKPASTYRIAFLGASYEMGFAVEQDDIYEGVAERIVNENLGEQGAVEILNFGVPGYGLIQWVEHAQGRVWEFAPDAVFVTAHTGDIFRTTGFLTEAVQSKAELSPPLQDLVDRAGIKADMSEAEIQRRLNRKRLSGESFSVELYRWGYGEIVKACKEHGAVPVWVYIPRSEDVKGGRDKAEQQQLAEAAGMVVLDADGVWEGVNLAEIQVAPWDRHPNADGHRILGEKLAAEILEHRDALGLGQRAVAENAVK